MAAFADVAFVFARIDESGFAVAIDGTELVVVPSRSTSSPNRKMQASRAI